MNRNEISIVMDKMANRHIKEALDWEEHRFVRKKAVLSKVAAAAFFLVSIAGIGTIAFAANVDFRNAVISFIADFSKEEKEEIRGGHRTMNLDKEEVLLEFLYSFEEKNSIKYDENGFEYIFIEENAFHTKAIVTCASKDRYLLVELKGSEIEKGVNAWKVSSYSYITDEQEKRMTGKTKKGSETIPENSPKDSVIKAEKNHGKIYHAWNKDNIATLTEKETKILGEILEQYETDEEEGWDGQDYNYIILFHNQDFMMTSEGEVIKETKEQTIGFKLKSKDLKKIMQLFEKYHIS